MRNKGPKSREWLASVGIHTLDAGVGREQSPADLDTIADLQKIPKLLTGRGYRDDDIADIMHANWLRLLRQAWSKSYS